MERNYSLSEAAVMLVLFRDVSSEKILLTRRPLTLREHAGEVALPGGKREAEDTSLYRTALRECHEEVGIEYTSLTYKAELEPHLTRSGTHVTPFVTELRESVPLELCSTEVESVKWVPMSVFYRDQRVKTHLFLGANGEYWAPVYEFEDYEIWGFTARVLVSFVNRFYGGQITRAHPTALEERYN